MGEELQVVTFTLGVESYGVAISAVQEIVPMLPVIRVPDAPAWIEGVVDLRGTILPVLDLRRRFGLPDLADCPTRCIVIVNLASGRVGVAVDAVCAVTRIAPASISPVPSAQRARFLQGIARISEDSGHSLLLLLEPEQLLSGGEVELLASLT